MSGEVKKIDSIKNMAVFHDFRWASSVRDGGNNIAEFKKINIFYGRNYSGKTTLSRIFRALETGSISDKYSSPEFQLSFEGVSCLLARAGQCSMGQWIPSKLPLEQLSDLFLFEYSSFCHFRGCCLEGQFHGSGSQDRLLLCLLLGCHTPLHPRALVIANPFGPVFSRRGPALESDGSGRREGLAWAG